jgi:hypothetical protein
MNSEHPPGSPGAEELDNAVRELHARLHFYMKHGPTRRTALDQVALLGNAASRAIAQEAELRTLRARVGELESETARLLDENEQQHSTLCDETKRAESAEARVKELETKARERDQALSDYERALAHGSYAERSKATAFLWDKFARGHLHFWEYLDEEARYGVLALRDALERSAAARITDLESQPAAATQAARNLVARIDGDGGQKQDGESVRESCDRADGVVVRLQARVKELEAAADRNANVIYADESVERYRKRIADLESQLAVATQAARNLVARIDGDGGQKQDGESVRESCDRADGVVVRLQARVKELEAELSAYDVSEDELAAARDITRDYDEVRYRLVHLAGREEPGGDPIREFVTEIESRVELLESQLAAAREEQGLARSMRILFAWAEKHEEASIPMPVFHAYLSRVDGGAIKQWKTPIVTDHGVYVGAYVSPIEAVKAVADALAKQDPALLRAILDVEKGGGG